jgi:flagellar biosynthesis protein FlhG
VEEAEDLIVETPYPKVYLIAGDGLIPGTANIPFFIKRKLIKQLNNMVADFVLLDLGAGTTNNTLDFFLMSPTAMVITIPETTAILNAYSFLKSALYRALFRSFKAKSPQRELIQAFMTQKLEGSGQNLRDLVDKMAQIRPKDAEKIVDTLEHFLPAVVINMGQTRNDLLLGQKLNDIISKNLTIKLSFMGYLGWDEKARAAVNQRKTLTELSPQGDFIPRLQKVRDKLIAFATTPGLELFDPDDDIDELEAGFKPDIDTGF